MPLRFPRNRNWWVLAHVTPEQVNAAINNGVAFLEKQQRPDGRFYEYESEPAGGTAVFFSWPC